MERLLFERNMNPLRWALVMVLLVVVAGAIYAATTWNNSDDNVGTLIKHGPVNQLPDQSRMVQDIQAQPDSTNTLKNSSPAQVQAATGSSTSTQNPQPQPTGSANDYYYPRDPNYCGPTGREVMCIAPQP